MPKLRLGHKQKECEFHFEEIEGQDVAILDKIDGEPIEDILPSDYVDYERYLAKAIKEGRHLEEEERFY